MDVEEDEAIPVTDVSDEGVGKGDDESTGEGVDEPVVLIDEDFEIAAPR